MRFIEIRFRLLRRMNFRYLRLLLYSIFRLWLKRIHFYGRLPDCGPCIIVCNHTSYVDWIILSAIYKEKYLVFLGNDDLNRRPIVNWLMKLNRLIYINPRNPGYSYFREVIRKLGEGFIVVIYPEGTRSKTGDMIEPKVGFVKLALVTKVPIIPIGLKGARGILPPAKKIPKLRRCEIFVGKPIMVNSDNVLFKDIFERDVGHRMISKDSMQEIAFRIMDLIRCMVSQKWDHSVSWTPPAYYLKKQGKLFLSRII